MSYGTSTFTNHCLLMFNCSTREHMRSMYFLPHLVKSLFEVQSFSVFSSTYLDIHTNTAKIKENSYNVSEQQQMAGKLHNKNQHLSPKLFQSPKLSSARHPSREHASSRQGVTFLIRQQVRDQGLYREKVSISSS